MHSPIVLMLLRTLINILTTLEVIFPLLLSFYILEDPVDHEGFMHSLTVLNIHQTLSNIIRIMEVYLSTFTQIIQSRGS